MQYLDEDGIFLNVPTGFSPSQIWASVEPDCRKITNALLPSGFIGSFKTMKGGAEAQAPRSVIPNANAVIIIVVVFVLCVFVLMIYSLVVEQVLHFIGLKPCKKALL